MENTDKFFKTGVEQFFNGDYSGAIRNLSSYVKYHPQHLDAHKLLAECYLLTEHPEAAHAAVEPFYKHYQKDDRLNFLVGRSLVLLNRYDEAITPLETALRFKPDNAVARLNLALALGASGAVTQSLEHIYKVLDDDPADLQAHITLLVVLRGNGREDDAKKHIVTLMDTQPAIANKLKSLGLG